MKRSKSVLKKSILGFSLLFIVLLGVSVTPVFASTNYQAALAKGTELYVVKKYNSNAWNSTFTSNLTPTTWFAGDSNHTGAERKVTTKGTSLQSSESTYTLFSSFFFSGENLALLYSLAQYGYNESEINAMYPNTYQTWFGIQAEWYFTTGQFEETPNATSNVLIILQNPAKYKEILDNYNNFVYQVLNDTSIPLIAKAALENYTADEFMQLIVFNGFTLASPFHQYLSTMINTLNCVNTTSSLTSNGNVKLTMTGYSKTEYTIELTYGKIGTISQVNVKSASGTTIYEITTYNENWIFFTALFVIIGIVIVVAGILIYRKIKSKR